ncbi:hypothetical protein [uncultured Shewanella sp.]|uniref:hypothetical protein n=1 Tax=uncultured Shewanella sp. TaxID=173975 RepID=UPI0026334C22|nr:hypothetical protein [uncultured Shewanella sp.]
MCDGAGEVNGGVESDSTSDMAKEGSLNELSLSDWGQGQSAKKWIGRLNVVLGGLCIVMLVMILL